MKNQHGIELISRERAMDELAGSIYTALDELRAMIEKRDRADKITVQADWIFTLSRRWSAIMSESKGKCRL